MVLCIDRRDASRPGPSKRTVSVSQSGQKEDVRGGTAHERLEFASLGNPPVRGVVPEGQCAPVEREVYRAGLAWLERDFDEALELFFGACQRGFQVMHVELYYVGS